MAPACRQAGNGILVMFYVYILQLSDGTFYKGQTENLNKRLEEHLSGNVRSTKSKRPLYLIHVEICDTRLEALEIEKYFKSGFGREIISEIAGVACPQSLKR